MTRGGGGGGGRKIGTFVCPSARLLHTSVSRPHTNYIKRGTSGKKVIFLVALFFSSSLQLGKEKNFSASDRSFRDVPDGHNVGSCGV